MINAGDTRSLSMPPSDALGRDAVSLSQTVTTLRELETRCVSTALQIKPSLCDQFSVCN